MVGYCPQSSGLKLTVALRAAANALAKKATLAFLIAVAGISTAAGAELLMFEHPGCPWCHQWNREVGAVYSKTEEGKAAPLRRILVTTGAPAGIRLAAPVNATPTFVLIDRGEEIGRITGYNNQEAFWGLLGQLLKRRTAL